MINNSVDVHKNNPFDIVSPQISDNTYWLNHKKIKKNTILKTDLPDTIIMTPKKARETNNAKIIGLSIAGAVVFVTGGLFLLFSGPKGLSKGFQKLKLYYEKKLEKSKLGGLKSSGHYEYILGKIDKLSQKIDAVNNFNTIKDFLFKKIMHGWSVTKKIHSKITEWFENFGLKTVKNSYKSTSQKFHTLDEANNTVIQNLHTSINDGSLLTINGVTRRKSEWLKIAQEKSSEITKLYSDNFSTAVREKRYLEIKKFIKELEQNFDKDGLNVFLSKDTLNTFIAEAKISPQKAKLQNEISGVRHKISYSLKDLYSDISNSIMKISSTLGVKDKDALSKLNKLKDTFKRISKGEKIDDLTVLKEFDDLNISLFKPSVSGKSTSDVDVMSKSLDDLRNAYFGYKRGNVDELLDIYKNLLPQKEYAKVEKAYMKAVDSLDKSIKLETEDFVSKARDLALGSAPTDILSVLGGVATLAYLLTKADDNRERTSISLKYGIPAIAGFGVSLYSNARLFAGTKSMVLGIASSLILNKIGSIANDILNKHYPVSTQNTADKKQAA